ncbi:MAG: tetratricopeptide repeat protein [Elusimicrobiota bacterium]
MNISYWKSFLFFGGALLFAYLLLPTARDAGRLLSTGVLRDKALIFLEKQYHRDPADRNNSFRYLNALLDKEEYNKFERTGRRLLEYFPESLELRRTLADYYEGVYSFPDAVRQWAIIMSFTADKDEKKETAGKYVSYLKLNKKFDLLLKYYEDLGKNGKLSREAEHLYADLLLKLNKPQEALQRYEKILQKYPEDAKADRRKIELLSLTGERKKLLEDIFSEIEHAAAGEDALLAFREQVSMIPERKIRIKAYERFLETGDNEDVRLDMCETLRDTGDYKKGLEALASVKENRANRQRIWYLKGEFYYLAGSSKRALYYIEKYLGLYPENMYFRGLLVELYIKENNSEKALQNAEILIGSERYEPEMLLTAANLYIDLGKKEEAIEKLIAYHAEIEGDFSSHDLLGDLYAGLGRTAQSREEYEKALYYIRKR